MIVPDTTARPEAAQATLRALYERLRASHQACAEFLLRDDPTHRFLAPGGEKKLTAAVPAFHQEIYALMDDPAQQMVAIGAPRGYGKSVLCSIAMPLHAALFREHADILLVSATEALAIEWLMHLRHHFESNERVLRYWGSMKSEKWTQTELVLTNGVVLRAKGLGAQIRGFHPSLIVGDDIETDESVGSGEQRAKVKEWFTRVLVNALALDGRLFMIGTILSPLAYLKELLELPPAGWTTRLYRAYADGPEALGQELWPAVWPHQRLQARKAIIGSWAFAAEYMNRPVPPDERRFDTATMLFQPEVPSGELAWYMTTDPAVSQRADADFKAAVSACTDAQGTLYLVSYLNQRGPTSAYINAILNDYRFRRHRKIGVEEVAMQKLFSDELNRVAREQQLYPTFTPLKLNTQMKKSYRIEALEPRITQGGLRFVGTREYWQPLLAQLDDYQGEGSLKHDDLLDCVASLLEIIEPAWASEAPEPSLVDSYAMDAEGLSEDLVLHGATGYGEEVGDA